MVILLDLILRGGYATEKRDAKVTSTSCDELGCQDYEPVAVIDEERERHKTRDTFDLFLNHWGSNSLKFRTTVLSRADPALFLAKATYQDPYVGAIKQRSLCH